MPSNILSTFTAEQLFTVTGLQSLASSPTAGWTSAYIDNTGTKYTDAFISWISDPANTAPANDKAIYMFGWGALLSSEMPTTGAATGGTVGTQGALTFPDITTTQIALQLIAVQPYTVADNVMRTSAFSLRRRMGWNRLPPYWGVAVLNYCGAGLAASGNKISWVGNYDTAS